MLHAGQVQFRRTGCGLGNEVILDYIGRGSLLFCECQGQAAGPIALLLSCLFPLALLHGYVTVFRLQSILTTFLLQETGFRFRCA